MKTSIMMLTWRRLPAVQACLWSLRDTLGDDVELLILDNGSDAAMIGWLEKFRDHHPSTTLYLSAVNRGVAGGRQFLLDRATGLDLVFLDSDVVITHPDWLKRLQKALDDPAVGLAGPAGHMIHRSWKRFIPLDPDKPGECDVVSGYCQAFRRTAVDQGVHLDMEYGKYWMEDSDFCLQLKHLNYLIWHTGEIGVRHVFAGSGDDGSFNQKMAYMASKWRGKDLIDAEKNLPI